MAPMGTPYVAPQPPFSTYTTMAICGSSSGAKPMKTEWSLPCGFCAVPVLPQASTSGSIIPTMRHVPLPVLPVTAARIPSATHS